MMWSSSVLTEWWDPTSRLGRLPAENGMAFILVQHLDPTHPSMMVELLSRDTAMTVLEAA